MELCEETGNRLTLEWLGVDGVDHRVVQAKEGILASINSTDTGFGCQRFQRWMNISDKSFKWLQY